MDDVEIMDFVKEELIKPSDKEGWKAYAYEDAVGVKTIGYGFNISRKSDAAIWLAKKYGQSWLNDARKEAKPGYPKDKRKSRLGKEDADDLLDHLLEKSKEAVEEWYGGVDLTGVQKGVLMDLHYHGGTKFIGKKTNFYKSVHAGNWLGDYGEDVNPEEFTPDNWGAIHEIRHRSNKDNLPGITIRNEHRADLLAQSYVAQIRAYNDFIDQDRSHQSHPYNLREDPDLETSLFEDEGYNPPSDNAAANLTGFIMDNASKERGIDLGAPIGAMLAPVDEK